MDFVEMLPVIIYLLLIVLLIILIVLGIKLIIIINKTDKLVSDVQEKVSSFDSAFRLVNIISDRLSIGVTTIVDGIISLINKLFKKRKEDNEDYD